MSRQPHKDVKGDAYDQWGAAGNIDQRGESARRDTYPEARRREGMAQPPARNRDGLRQRRIYDEEDEDD